MNDDLIFAFDACLTAMQQGETLEACLARYPELAGDLRPMLQAAVEAGAQAAPAQIPRRAEMASRAGLLTRAAELRGGQVGRPAWWRLVPRLATTALVFVVGFAAGAYGLAAASAQSLPGDSLYGIKRAAEQVRWLITTDPIERATYQQALEDRRAQEARDVIKNGRTVEISLQGELTRLDGEQWIVKGLSVTVPAGTPIQGTPMVGQPVLVVGLSQPGGLVARRVVALGPTPTASPPPTRTLAPTATASPRPSATSAPSRTERGQEVEFEGRLTGISGSVWTIGGQAVIVNAATEIEDNPQIGQWLEVRALRQPDGSLIGRRIRVEDEPEASGTPGGGPAPSKTPAPGTNTPEPTETDRPEEVEFEGVVQAMGSVWVIGGQSVVITPATEFRDNPQLGDTVRVRALRMPDGTLVAERIEKR